MKKLWHANSFHYMLMLAPGIILTIMFHIVPLYGVALAFKNFNPSLGIWGSPWAGLEHFRYIFYNPQSKQILFNTVYIAVLKIVTMQIIPVTFAVLLNELRKIWFKRTVQTIVYLPHFLSWVVIAGIMREMLSLDGLINNALGNLFGLDPIMFLGSNEWFRPILIATHVWKEFGFSTIIYLAALTSINPALYEAAAIDGASRLRRIWHIALPGVRMTFVLLATLSLDDILNAGFDQIFNLYNVLVYRTADIIDTYVFRAGLVSYQYEVATAIGLAKSLFGFILISFTYWLAYKLFKYRIW
ncbi:sugar ABC transporter permease [Paenibacillus sp. YN15]|uniref:ABC transporter permease n=1 Tax=Paenibacillus sp. YN15 TaxID=1742774 RepID=UPI000DCE8F46|nr:ABC transporter permease subunit [Paenibacillus sp. YN15]RAV05501.1 sugar ABC transporter permease [Paenibacillus sp. YN15]